MKRKKAVSLMLIGALLVAVVASMFSLLTLTMGVTPQPGEPTDLQDLVEFPELPGETIIMDLEKEPVQRDIAIDNITQTDDYGNVSNALEQKGYEFDLTQATVEEVGNPGFGAYVLSCWSTNFGPNGTRAFIAAMYEYNTDESIVVGAVTNLLPPDQVPGVDPYIIVNAMPYMFIRWYWYSWPPVSDVVSWYYWWYDSHSHSNWYWSCYWWWRTYVAYYTGGAPYKTWWWWFWHWVYWKHWYWWSTYFGPYYHDYYLTP